MVMLFLRPQEHGISRAGPPAKQAQSWGSAHSRVLLTEPKLNIVTTVSLGLQSVGTTYEIWPGTTAAKNTPPPPAWPPGLSLQCQAHYIEGPLLLRAALSGVCATLHQITPPPILQIRKPRPLRG